MLYPQSNPFRQYHDLSGFWEFHFDPEDIGVATGWAAGFSQHRPIAVPASWNDQFTDGRDYLGPAWYQTRFDLPWEWAKQHVCLRFGSANYLTQVWLNGIPLGQHEGGHLPFEFDVTSYLRSEGNLLVVRVEGVLAPDRVPSGNVEPNPLDTFSTLSYPATTFDFFPFCGIQRPVLLYTLPHEAITDLTVVTELEGRRGRVWVNVERSRREQTTVRLTLRGHGTDLSVDVPTSDVSARGVLDVEDAAPWSASSPNLYDLTVELLRNDEPLDRYSLPVGIRTIAVEGDKLLLNGEPILLRGFGRHEDFPVVGRGLVPAVIIKDYALMNWVGANSFRTTHYPYSEQMMDLADRLGFLVIDETPAVGLFFAEDGLQRRLELCRQYTSELIARDKNHPSVIMWSLANEPHSTRPAATAFFQTLYAQAKAQDPTRPVTVVSFLGGEEAAFAFCDVVCLNRYHGWYSEPGQLDVACAKLSQELDTLHEQYSKPLLLTEFGADALAGWHANPPELFSEEYQAELLARSIEVLNSKSYVVGQHVWNLCDFKTGQSIHRIGGFNLKGVFTRDRRPKQAAHRLRELWIDPVRQ